MRQQITTNIFIAGVEDQVQFRTTLNALADAHSQPPLSAKVDPENLRPPAWPKLTACAGANGLKAIVILALTVTSPVLRGQTTVVPQYAQQQQALEESIKLQQEQFSGSRSLRAAATPSPKSLVSSAWASSCPNRRCPTLPA